MDRTSFNGEIEVIILYTDKINVRRQVDKKVEFDSSYFSGRKRDEKTTSNSNYIIGAVVALIVLWWIRSSFKKRRKARERQMHGHHK